MVLGNSIGTDATGTAALGNGIDGVLINGGALGQHHRRRQRHLRQRATASTISGAGTSTATWSLGNFIGTDATGTAALGNTNDGVLIDGAAANNTVGGTATAARQRHLRQHGRRRRLPQQRHDGNLVQGNYIGTDAPAPRPSAMRPTASTSTTARLPPPSAASRPRPVPGPATSSAATDRHRLCATLGGSRSNGIVIRGNLHRHQCGGSAALGNAAAGVLISAGPISPSAATMRPMAPLTAPCSANVISGTTGTSQPFTLNGGPGRGIDSSGTGSGLTIQGNYIGTDVTGTRQLPNLTGVALGFDLANATSAAPPRGPAT